MEGFKLYLVNKDLAPRTIKRHLWYISYTLKSAPDFTFEQIDKFLLSLKENGCKNTYLNHLVPSIRMYADFKGLAGFREHYKYHKEEIFIKATMSDEEIEKLLSLSCPPHAVREHWYKFTVFFSIMAYCGLRPLEVAALTKDNIDLSQNIITITQGKTPGSIGNIPIPPNIQALLKEYINTIENNLFPPKMSGKSNFGLITAAIWTNAFRRRLKLLGINRRNLTPYSLRHSYCTSILSAGASVFDAKLLMRHTDLKTTEHYYHYTMENLRKAQAKHPLIRRNTDPKHILQAITELIKSFHIEQDCRFNYRIEENDHSVRFEVYIK